MNGINRPPEGLPPTNVNVDVNVGVQREAGPTVVIQEKKGSGGCLSWGLIIGGVLLSAVGGFMIGLPMIVIGGVMAAVSSSGPTRQFTTRRATTPPSIPAKAHPALQAPARESLEVALLKAAAANSGELTVPRAVMETGASFQEVEAALRTMQMNGHADIDNLPQGTIVYRFPGLAGNADSQSSAGDD